MALVAALVLPLAGTRQAPRLTVARLQYDGGGDWYANPSSIPNLLTAIRPTREEALRWAGPLVVLRLNEPDWLKENGIDSKGITMPSGSGGLYPDPMHAEDHEAAINLAEQVPLELRAQIAEKLGLIGTPKDAIATLKKMASAGYDNV